MIKLPNLVDDAIRSRFVPFSLKDLAKKMALQFGGQIYYIVGQFCQDLLKKILPYPQGRLYEEKHNAV